MEALTDVEVAELRSLIEANSDPAATERLMAYWAEGEGAAKIGWDTPGDFDRCVSHLGKYVADPKGLCSNLHVRATGARPGHAAGEGATPMPTNIVESTTLARASDADPTVSGGRMAIQIITPGLGSSGYYSPQVLEAAAARKVITAGTPMYLDHPTETAAAESGGVRSVRDMAAVFTEDARWNGSALVAECKVFSPYRPILSEMAEHIGVSIRGSGEMSEGEVDGQPTRIIESLDQVASVDFVTAAGRGGRVLELLESARTQTAAEAASPIVPANPAGQSHTTQETTMAEIEEARLRTLEEADRRVPLLEAERDTAIRERDALAHQLAESNARTAATARARTRLTEANANLAPATVDRIVEQATRTVPLSTEGRLDEAAFDTATDAARTAEETYLAALAEATGAGTISGFGASTPTGGDVLTEAAVNRIIADAFGHETQEV